MGDDRVKEIIETVWGGCSCDSHNEQEFKDALIKWGDTRAREAVEQCAKVALNWKVGFDGNMKGLSDAIRALPTPSPTPATKVNLPANCPSCGKPLDWSNDETDIVGCRICGGSMCWECGSVPEGICNKCGEKMANEPATKQEEGK